MNAQRTSRDAYSKASVTLSGKSDLFADTARGHGRPQAPQPFFQDEVYDSPDETSEESMNINLEDTTPSESPIDGRCSQPGVPSEQIGRLSIDETDNNPSSYRGRALLSASTAKRAASSELAQTPGRYSATTLDYGRARQAPRGSPSKVPRKAPYGRQRHYYSSSGENPQRRMMESAHHVRPFVQSHDRLKTQTRGDSGYASMGDSRGNTIYDPRPPTAVPSTIDEGFSDGSSPSRKHSTPPTKTNRYPSLILQPDSSPITQEQLAAEVKGIYAGLVMVEAKCINIDANQAADPKTRLSPEQWQALIALHRTLLYEHHDFLMATQHPSATLALRGLATKYSMPARMWKHGIHAFLEVLRHRRPASQDYMLAFIYLAYQMMALLFETVPTFTDTWIECLGDLARYRMAIEEEKEAHATWGGVAARWYTMASDRHPAIGRLYHHLGILERPSLRKFCFYAKSLTCVIPFPNARDSLSTLCGPIVQDEQTIQSSRLSAEARIVTFHALIHTSGEHSLVLEVGAHAIELLLQQPTKLRDFGAYLGITNIAGLFSLGAPGNTLFQCYMSAQNQISQASQPSHMEPYEWCSQSLTSAVADNTSNPYLETSNAFWADTFGSILRGYASVSSLPDSLAYVHVMLVCLHSLHSLRTRLVSAYPDHTYSPPVDTSRLPWDALATYLNVVAHEEPITARLLECARQGVFLAPESKEDARPLSEDYLMRGLIWVQSYFCAGWFDGQAEDDGRAIETASTQQARAERVLWLGLYLAFHTENLLYDVHRRIFSAAIPAAVTLAVTAMEDNVIPIAAEHELESAASNTDQFSEVLLPGSRSSMAPSSSSSNSEDGFHIVKMPKARSPAPKILSPQRLTSPVSNSPPPSWAKVAAGRKPVGNKSSITQQQPPCKKNKNHRDWKNVNVASADNDDDEMVWSADGEFLQTEGGIRASGFSRA